MNFGIRERDVQKKPEDFYAIICPGTITTNSDFTVIASVHKSKVPVKIKVSINGGEFSITRIVEMQPYSYETITFSIPSINEGQYSIKAEGLSGIEFKHEKPLEYSKVNSFVLIQTDKATYKPGDLVRFRVLILDKETRPAKINETISISIMDSQQNIIQQVKTTEFTKGVYSGEMQLSQFPNLGKWKITVTGAKNSDSSNFEVDKYVLPKFEVTIDVPRDVYKDDDMIKAIVRAKYTYGKPVKGETTIKLSDKCQFWQGNTLKNYILTKTASIDGKFSFEIYMANEHYSGTACDPKNYEIEASVEETLTGLKMDATANFTIHTQRFKIEKVDFPRNFIKDAPLEVTVVVKNYDGSPVQDTLNYVTIEIEPERRLNPVMFYVNKDDADKAAEEKRKLVQKLHFQEKLDKNGMVTVNFIVTKDMADSYSIRVKYLEQEQFLGSISSLSSSSDSALQLYTQIEKARLDRQMAIQVTSKLPLKYFFYQIIAKGNIVEAGKIDVPENRTSYVFKFQPTFAMVPSCNVFVYFINDGDVVFAEKHIEIEPQLNGFIKINAPSEAKAGDEVELKVTTKPDSYVGLLGVDQSVLLLKSGNDLKNGDVINSLNKFKTRTLFESCFRDTKNPGTSSGVIMITNGEYEKETKEFCHQMFGAPNDLFGGMAKRCVGTTHTFGASPAKAMFSQPAFGGMGQQQLQAVPQVEIRKRKDFPETWLWWSSKENHNGEVVVRSKVPDTITSWMLTGFSVNPESGLGLTSQPHKLQVFQPFFISTNLPYSVKRGEVIAIPVVVFNYMEDNIKADLTLDNAHDEFEFVSLPGETKSKSDTNTQQTKPVEIDSGSGVSKSFLIRPKKAGQITLKISAVSPVAGDILHQVLRVDPEGVTEFVNKAVFLDLRDQKEQSREISIEVPENAVPDSTHIEVSVVGDLLGPTMKNLDKLVRMPCGCGEQNMVNFVPNILILKYLTKMNKAALDIADKAKKFLEIGYQRELTYKHNDGSYSAFGRSDKSGSTWLTAYVARSFSEAKEVTNIDEKAIKDALDFLVFRQSKDGNFAETGRIIDQHHAGKSTKGLALTAFTLLAFLELKEEILINPYKHVIDKGLEYLARNVDDETDNYALAISTYIFQKAKHDKKEIFLEKFKARKEKDGEHIWWADESKLPNIEITAYGLLALLESGAGEETLPVLKWLVGQRNSNGGFKSTQDTVIGLRAIVKLSEKLNDLNSVSFTFSDDKGGKAEIFVNEDNAIVFQTHVLNPEARLIKITGKGNGSSQVQVSYRYNIANKSSSPRFKIKPEVRETTDTDQIQLSVCASFIPQGDEKTSNMVVMEVSLPSGYIADEHNLNEIEKVERVKKVETKNGESVIVIYFDYLDGIDVCPLIKGFRAHRVAEQKPSAIIVYDYYDNNRHARAFYEIPNTSLNGLCDGA